VARWELAARCFSHGDGALEGTLVELNPVATLFAPEDAMGQRLGAGATEFSGAFGPHCAAPALGFQL
jgi:hypothetical protein